MAGATSGANAAAPALDPARAIADLRELDALTGGSEGARRVCWGEEWRAARALMEERLDELGLEAERDQAGNLWAYMEGEREPALALGSHLDSVPAGGWLDGALGVMAALEVLRAWRESGRRPRRTLALVDWADEEGARFGRSLFGSSAVAGTLVPDELRHLTDIEGRSATEVLAENGVDLDRAPEAASRRDRLGAYLELHIEQGPRLETRGLPVGAVSGCVGIERHRLTFTGQASHAGTTPMDARRDAGLAAAQAALAIEAVPADGGGVATTGALALRPGIPTAVPGRADLVVDLRHPDGEALERMLERTRGAARKAAGERGCELADDLVHRIAPVEFDAGLVTLARAACRDVSGQDPVLVSGALHDAAALSSVVPAVMLFAPSRRGISHAKEEDTSDEDLAVAIEAFGALAARALG